MKKRPEKTYSVAVVATMSAGKSTLLNAMIGHRLLPARNEACTASVCRIEDRDELPAFRGRTKVAGKWSRWKTPITSEILQKWNDCSHEEVSIEGNIKTIANTHNGYRVVFIDTPGPNNASCEDHAKITERVINEADFSSIVFVVNASVAGVEDEWRLLSRLQQFYSSAQKKSRIIFAINKVDLLDAEHGESVVDVLKACEAHLRGLHGDAVVCLALRLLVPVAFLADIALQLPPDRRWVASNPLRYMFFRTSLFTQRLDYDTLLIRQAVVLRSPGRGLSSFLCGHLCLLAFLCLQESIQPTPDFFNPRLKPAQQANHSRQNLPVLHWKLARAR